MDGTRSGLRKGKKMRRPVRVIFEQQSRRPGHVSKIKS
jgi:hypothetical protein